MYDIPIYFHSPFTPHTVAEGEGPSLLLQFILHEFVHSNGTSQKRTFFPFFLSYDKIDEYLQLLPYAFPDLGEEIQKLQANPSLAFLKPFVQTCKDNPYLLS